MKPNNKNVPVEVDRDVFFISCKKKISLQSFLLIFNHCYQIIYRCSIIRRRSARCWLCSRSCGRRLCSSGTLRCSGCGSAPCSEWVVAKDVIHIRTLECTSGTQECLRTCGRAARRSFMCTMVGLFLLRCFLYRFCNRSICTILSNIAIGFRLLRCNRFIWLFRNRHILLCLELHGLCLLECRIRIDCLPFKVLRDR